MIAELGYVGPPLAMDADAVHCCLMNLVDNGIDACRDGDRQGRGKRVVLTTLGAPGGGVEYRVQDTGCGMAPDVLQKLFQGFFSTKLTEGTGIGLMMTKRIVDQHGGSIDVRSQKDRGTTVIIRLPETPGAKRPISP
jgi:signal transduction histidine kinase